jgi:hypothetical protein
MARKQSRPEAGAHRTLEPLSDTCRFCGAPAWAAYFNQRTVVTLSGLLRLSLRVRRCINRTCPRYHRPYRPEQEGALALPDAEFGLDVLAFVGALRYREHRSVPEIHQALLARGVGVCERSVTNLVQRYEELVALHLADPTRLKKQLTAQGQVILALDGLQPDVGHEVLWVIRDTLSGEVLLARALLGATQEDLAPLLREVKAQLPVPITGVISDGQHSVRNAIAAALPGVPHQLCQFHYLREATLPIYEADRHAKKELKKRIRGVRPIERRLEKQTRQENPEAETTLGYCQAVRAAITDDGRPPLDAAGLRLHDRLEAIRASLARVQQKRGCRGN